TTTSLVRSLPRVTAESVATTITDCRTRTAWVVPWTPKLCEPAESTALAGTTHTSTVSPGARSPGIDDDSTPNGSWATGAVADGSMAVLASSSCAATGLVKTSPEDSGAVALRYALSTTEPSDTSTTSTSSAETRDPAGRSFVAA